MYPTFQSRSLQPLIMIVAGVVLIIGALGWMMNPGGLSQTTPAPPTPAIPQPEIVRVRLLEAKAAYDRHMAVFVDVRGEPYYSEGHIRGALSIALEDLPQRIDELQPEDWIIPYCT